MRLATIRARWRAVLLDLVTALGLWVGILGAGGCASIPERRPPTQDQCRATVAALDLATDLPSEVIGFLGSLCVYAEPSPPPEGGGSW